MVKEAWTVEAGPRVWRLAMFLGLPSKRVLEDLREHFDYQGRSVSSRVPLPMAFGVAAMWRPSDCSLLG